MEIDLDVSELLSPEKVIAACETEDELGCVLRLHLAFERLVEFYIRHSATSEQIKFIEKTNEFGEKLKRAVLLGLPLSVAEVGKQLGQIRNKVAHEQNPINRHRLDNLIILVDRMMLDSPSPQPVSKRKLQLFMKKPGEAILLGSHGDMYDFIIAAGTAYHGATMIVVKSLALKFVAKNTMDAKK
jgi:hypothetical protein